MLCENEWILPEAGHPLNARTNILSAPDFDENEIQVFFFQKFFQFTIDQQFVRRKKKMVVLVVQRPEYSNLKHRTLKC